MSTSQPPPTIEGVSNTNEKDSQKQLKAEIVSQTKEMDMETKVAFDENLPDKDIKSKQSLESKEKDQEFINENVAEATKAAEPKKVKKAVSRKRKVKEEGVPAKAGSSAPDYLVELNSRMDRMGTQWQDMMTSMQDFQVKIAKEVALQAQQILDKSSRTTTVRVPASNQTLMDSAPSQQKYFMDNNEQRYGRQEQRMLKRTRYLDDYETEDPKEVQDLNSYRRRNKEAMEHFSYMNRDMDDRARENPQTGVPPKNTNTMFW